MFVGGQVVFEGAEVYHARNGISASSIKTFLASPEQYFREVVLGYRRESTASMDFGTTVHDDALLPAWERSYVVIPPEVLASNGARRGKPWLEFQEANRDKILIKQSDVERVEKIREAIARNPLATDFLTRAKDGLVEITITAEHECSPVRGRLDILLDDAIVDLKTCAVMGEREMQVRAVDHKWALQAVMYRELVASIRGVRPRVYFVAVETKEPFRCEIYVPSEASLDSAKDLLEWALQEIADRKASGDWNRYGFPDPIFF
jgi:hypothetical protein